MRKKELKNEILNLRWGALPIYERLVYSREICKEKNIHLEDQLNAQKWQAQRNTVLAILLLVFSLLSLLYPATNWQLFSFLIASSATLLIIESALRKRIKLLKKAVKLRKKLRHR